MHAFRINLGIRHTTLYGLYIRITVCSYYVTYAFQSESTLCSCLNVKQLLARNRRYIWSLSDWNGTRTHNHFVRKRTLNHLWVRVPLQSHTVFNQQVIINLFLIDIHVFSLYFPTFISLFSLIVYLVRFNTNNILTRVSISFPCLLKRMVLLLILRAAKNFK